MAMNTTQTFLQSIYEMLMQSQHWPPEQMQEFQRSQLAQLLRHAKANVPFYKSRLDCVFKRNGEIDWDRWHEIPIITRAELRDNYGLMLASTLPPGHGPSKTFRSSGSSGIPVAIEATAIMSVANQAAAIRFAEIQHIDTAKTRAKVSSSTITGERLSGEYHRGKWGKPWEDQARKGESFIINRALPDNRKLQLIGSLGVSYFQEITNNAELLAKANLVFENPVKLEAITCVSQKLENEHRDLFRKSFGARSLSIYSSKEGGLMGCQCGDSYWHHVNNEIIFIETVTLDDNICNPGQVGRVIITPFFGTALPLIRYDQGDLAELHPNCSCGNPHPILKNITGRQDQLLKLPEGQKAVGVLFQRLMEEDMNALAFQLAQIATLKLEIRYIPADAARQIIATPIIAQIRNHIHPEMEVTFKRVDKLPLNSGGKLQRVVCEI
jgi:phenylacetate-CoA ligase